MNYLWEILLQAKAQGIEKEDIRFRQARSYSPYIELSEEFLNLTKLEEPCLVEINSNYRFQQVFQELFHPDVRDYPALRAGLFQLLLHQIGENDVRAGMTREEYYKKFWAGLLRTGITGRRKRRHICCFRAGKGILCWKAY